MLTYDHTAACQLGRDRDIEREKEIDSHPLVAIAVSSSPSPPRHYRFPVSLMKTVGLFQIPGRTMRFVGPVPGLS